MLKIRIIINTSNEIKNSSTKEVLISRTIKLCIGFSKCNK